jgi:hypothetical protein
MSAFAAASLAPVSLVSRWTLETLDIASNILLGAILALTWFGMPREFGRPQEEPWTRGLTQSERHGS